MKRLPALTYHSDQELSLALNEAIANIADTDTLFKVIYETLRSVFHFELSAIILPSENPEYGQLYLQAMSVPEELRNIVNHNSLPIREVLSGFDPYSLDILTFSASEIHHQKSGLTSELEVMEKALGIQFFTLCPLVHSGKIIGHWILGNGRRGNILETDIPQLRQVSKIIAGAVASTTAYAKLSQREQEAQRLLSFTTAIMDIHQPREFFFNLTRHLHSLRSFHFASVHGLRTEDGSDLCLLFDAQGPLPLLEEALPPLPGPMDSSDFRVNVRYFAPDWCATHAPPLLVRLGIAAVVQIHLDMADAPITLTLGSRNESASALLVPGLFEQVGPQLYLAFHNLHIWQEVLSLKDRLQQENRVLLDEMVPAPSHQLMIGQSPNFRNMQARARQVAPSDATVLLLGETGTGKEVLARFLHDTSLRHEKPMVRVNCAALPSQLIESELFGHEKGSFTGATERRLGKFELAQGGTLFLDEIGEIPLESQAKLLRVLQEREFERVGGHQVLHADVRVVAATNRDLGEEVRKGTFRADLYFRLSVFPLTLPPLRERREDIALLAEAFLRRAAKKLGRAIRPLERPELELLESYSWPGNIRELEHVMENAAILAKDSTPNLRDFRKLALGHDPEPDAESLPFLEDMVRTHILRALRKTKGRIGGAQGAAALLGLNEKTLGSKMRKLGIHRKVDFN